MLLVVQLWLKKEETGDLVTYSVSPNSVSRSHTSETALGQDGVEVSSK